MRGARQLMPVGCRCFPVLRPDARRWPVSYPAGWAAPGHLVLWAAMKASVGSSSAEFTVTLGNDGCGRSGVMRWGGKRACCASERID
jgi:hypothetical protein